jgi:iron complex transport system substrate-binding protein
MSKLRIISLAPNVTSILHALGATAELVAVSRWCKDVAPVKNLPTVGDCWKLNTAEVMRHKPDILIGSVPFALETVEEILAQPVSFLAINPRSLADIERDIRTLGRLVGRQAEAEKLVRKMASAFASIRLKSRKKRGKNATVRTRAAKPVVYCEAWPNPRISSPPWVGELIGQAGATTAVPAGTQVTDAQVAAANPDVIVLAWTATGTRSKPETALTNPAWRDVTAIKSRRVHVIRDEILNTPGPPLIQGAEELFRAIWQT